MGLRGMRWSLAVCAGVLGAVVGASPALAHNSFTGSNPEDGATVETLPAEIELRFLEAVDRDGARVTITGPHGTSGMSGNLRFDGQKIYAPFGAGGKAGKYTVEYQIPSDDGHPIKGDFSFTIAEAALAAPSSPTGTAPVAPTPTAAASAAPAAPASSEAVPATDAPVLNPATSTDDGGTPWWPWAVGGVLLVIAVAGGTIAYGRRRAAS